MLKGGVIMDVTNAKEAIIAEKAGAYAVMALERVPSDIRKDGDVARMSDPKMIKEIQAAVSIPVMAKVRIGHFVEGQILESLSVAFIYESEVLTLADAALMMQLGSEGVFVGSGIFKSADPERTAKATVLATTFYNDPMKLAEISEDLGAAMSGTSASDVSIKYAKRGW